MILAAKFPVVSTGYSTCQELSRHTHVESLDTFEVVIVSNSLSTSNERAKDLSVQFNALIPTAMSLAIPLHAAGRAGNQLRVTGV